MDNIVTVISIWLMLSEIKRLVEASLKITIQNSQTWKRERAVFIEVYLSELWMVMIYIITDFINITPIKRGIMI